MMRLFIAMLFASAVFASPMAASAAPPLRDEAAVRLDLSRRFIAALQTDQMTAMIGQLSTSLSPSREGMTQAQSDALDRAMATMNEQMMSRMFDAMAPIYADIFTREELTALVAFYESDIGQSMMTKSYAAAPRITAVVLAMMPDLMRGMADSMCKEMGCTAKQRADFEASIALSGFGPTSAPASPSAKGH